MKRYLVTFLICFTVAICWPAGSSSFAQLETFGDENFESMEDSSFDEPVRKKKRKKKKKF